MIAELGSSLMGPQVSGKGTRMRHLKETVPESGRDDQSGAVIINLNHDIIFQSDLRLLRYKVTRFQREGT